MGLTSLAVAYALGKRRGRREAAVTIPYRSLRDASAALDALLISRHGAYARVTARQYLLAADMIATLCEAPVGKDLISKVEFKCLVAGADPRKART